VAAKKKKQEAAAELEAARQRAQQQQQQSQSGGVVPAVNGPAPSSTSGFSPRFDHICLAVSDVSHMSSFLTLAGGRACEGFLTPVYLSSTWEFANCAELQVIAPVESFQRKKQALSQQDERGTTTKAFWDGNSTPASPQQQQQQQQQASPAAAAGTEQLSSSSSSSSSSAAGIQRFTVTAASRPRSTFLQRYLRRHGPSVHHVAFLVPDLARAKARFQSFGYTIYGWSDRDPLWKECTRDFVYFGLHCTARSRSSEEQQLPSCNCSSSLLSRFPVLLPLCSCCFLTSLSDSQAIFGRGDSNRRGRFVARRPELASLERHAEPDAPHPRRQETYRKDESGTGGMGTGRTTTTTTTTTTTAGTAAQATAAIRPAAIVFFAARKQDCREQYRCAR
jgi:hypothetical protein